MNATHRLPSLLGLVSLLACGASGAQPPGPDGGVTVADGGLLALDGTSRDGATPLPDAGGAPDAPWTDPDAGGPDPLSPIARSHDGGRPSAVALSEGRALVGIGPRLVLYDLEDLAVPSRLGESAPLEGVVTSVAAAGDLAFVTTASFADGRVHVFDVSDPSMPVEKASLRLGSGTFSRPADLALAGTRLYVADDVQGVFALDVSTPETPTVIMHHQTAGAMSLVATETRVYCTLWHGLGGVLVLALDPTASLAPLADPAYFPTAVAATVTADHLAVVSGGPGIEIYDLAEPASPLLIHAVSGAVSWVPTPAANAVWVPATAGLYRIDLSDRAAIVNHGPFTSSAGHYTAAATAGRVLVGLDATGQLVTIDVEDPTAPNLAGAVSTGPCAGCAAVAADGERLAITDAFSGAAGAVHAATLHDLRALGSRHEQPAVFESVALGGGIAYVADWASGLRVYDLAAPAQPQLVAQLPTGGYPSSVALAADRLYLGESTNGGVLRVFDVANPIAPVELGAGATSKVRDLAVQGQLVYVADEGLFLSAALRIFDASNPSQLEVIGSYEGCTSPVGVAVSGGTAVLACGYDGFHIIDVSTPTAPTAVASWAMPLWSEATAVSMSGTRAYLGHSSGVIAIDLAVPGSPVQIDTRVTAARVKDLLVPAPGRLVAAAGDGGLYQWDL